MKILKLAILVILTLVLGLVIYYLYPQKKLAPLTKIDSLVVFKSKRQLLAYSDRKLVKTYSIALGFQPIGAKTVEGDGKTPEGRYIINDKNAQSAYHKNLGISYPNKMDIANAKKLGKSAGGSVKIHALKNGSFDIGKFQRWSDWTNGCIALSNQEIDELFTSVQIGTPIDIFP